LLPLPVFDPEPAPWMTSLDCTAADEVEVEAAVADAEAATVIVGSFRPV